MKIKLFYFIGTILIISFLSSCVLTSRKIKTYDEDPKTKEKSNIKVVEFGAGTEIGDVEAAIKLLKAQKEKKLGDAQAEAISTVTAQLKPMTKEDYEKLAPETILKQTGKLVAFMLAGQYFVAEGYGNKSIYNRNSNPIAQSTSKASNARVGTSSAQVTEIDGGILLNRKIYAYDQENNYYYGPVPTKEILHLLNTDPDYRERWKKPGGIHYYRKSNQTN